MIWVLIAVGLAAWMLVVLFFLALCHAAGQADERAKTAGLDSWRTTSAGLSANVIDLRAFACRHEHRAAEMAPRASAVG